MAVCLRCSAYSKSLLSSFLPRLSLLNHYPKRLFSTNSPSTISHPANSPSSPSSIDKPLASSTQKTFTKGIDYEEMIQQDEQKKAEYKKIGARFTPEQLQAEITKIVTSVENNEVVSPERFAHIIESCDYQVDKAELLFSLAKKTNQIDLFVYNAMISVYTRSKKVQEAMAILNSMAAPTHATYYFIINGFGKIRDVDNMFSALEQMKAKNIKPTIAIYNLLIDWCNEANKFTKVDEIFEMIKNDDIKPDNETYTLLAPIYAGTEKLEELMVMLRDKKRVVISDSYATFVNSMNKAIEQFGR